MNAAEPADSGPAQPADPAPSPEAARSGGSAQPVAPERADGTPRSDGRTSATRHCSSWPSTPTTARLREHSPRPGVTVLEVIGEIDALEADSIRVRLTEMLDRGRPERAVLDLSGVAFLGSHGLTAVVRSSRVAGAAGVPLCGVTGPDNRAVIRPVRMTGLDQVIRWFPDLGDALDHDTC